MGMPGSGIIDLAIGLAFAFGATAAAAAGAPPARAPSAASALLGGTILRNQGMTGQISSRKLTSQSGQPPKMADGKGGNRWRERRTLPSYIPARSFAEAVLDLLVPDAAGHTTMDAIGKSIARLPASMSTLKLSLQSLAKNAGNDVAAFRTSVEHWYDDHMDRVSGWYKRYVAKITLVVGAVLVLLLNINALTIART